MEVGQGFMGNHVSPKSIALRPLLAALSCRQLLKYSSEFPGLLRTSTYQSTGSTVAWSCD